MVKDFYVSIEVGVKVVNYIFFIEGVFKDFFIIFLYFIKEF